MHKILTPLIPALLAVFSGFSQFVAPKDVLRENFSHTQQQIAGTLLPAASDAASRSGIAEVLNAAFDSVTNLSVLTGFTASVVLPDDSAWKRAHGTNAGIPFITALNTSHLMGMGSITKTFVSATLLLLVEDGLLSLDDSIGQYVGPYPNISGQATVRQVLSHRTGFNDYLNENPATTDQWAEHLDSIWEADTLLSHYVLEPNFALGSDWSYSNTNFLLAGRIIETVTGQPWYQVVRQRVLAPNGLTHTFAYPWETTGGQPIAHVWLDVDGNSTVDDMQGLGLPIDGFFSLAGSAGCLMSTPEDIARFDERLFSGHILQAATLAEMQTDYVQNAGTGIEYGLGAISYLGFGMDNWGHDGSILYKSIGLYFPDLDIAIAVQQNDIRTSANSPAYVDLVDVLLSLLQAYLDNAPSSGTAAPTAAEQVRVAPNPAADWLNIVVPDGTELPARCEIYDAQGRTVLTWMLGSDKTILSVDQLPAGAYQLRIGGLTQRFVIER